MRGYVALVLHAHLPWVSHPEHPRSLEERWLFEALWECYLPLLDRLERLADEGIPARITLSVSPTLAEMLGDAMLRRRFLEHLGRVERLASAERARSTGDPARAELLAFYLGRISAARASFERVRGDVLGAFVALERAGTIELMTTAATHAFLPGLLATPASIRAQLRLGLGAFERRAGLSPRGLWLPECAYDPRLDEHLVDSGVKYAVLDAHGLELATPRPPMGVFAPVIAPSGLAFFARDPEVAREVWSREVGYPGDPAYRDFYRDAGFDLPADRLEGETGPEGTRLMTGLKLHRITGGDGDKLPYVPAAAEARAREHAAHFVARRIAQLSELPEHLPVPPVVVAPYDAELFGHWWFEGPTFLEHVVRELAAAERRSEIAATTLGGYLDQNPRLPLASPAPSTWGEGGFAEVWVGPKAAPIWRHVHHAERAVRDALARARSAEGPRGRALELAVRELMLLESSDWPFMIARDEAAEYAGSRVRTHARRARRLAELATGGEPSADEVGWIDAVASADRFLADAPGADLREALEG